jgi:hypothetical protein
MKTATEPSLHERSNSGDALSRILYRSRPTEMFMITMQIFIDVLYKGVGNSLSRLRISVYLMTRSLSEFSVLSQGFSYNIFT